MGNEQSAPVEEMHEQYERLSETIHILHRCNRSLLEYSQSIGCSVRSVAAVAVTVLVLSGSLGCAKSPQISTRSLPEPSRPTLQGGAQFEDVNSNQTYVACSGPVHTVGWGGTISKLAIGECVDVFGDGNTIRMSPGHCLVWHKYNPVRFHIIACRDAAPGSCETDLGDGNVAKYVSPCSGNG